MTQFSKTDLLLALNVLTELQDRAQQLNLTWTFRLSVVPDDSRDERHALSPRVLIFEAWGTMGRQSAHCHDVIELHNLIGQGGWFDVLSDAELDFHRPRERPVICSICGAPVPESLMRSGHHHH